ncbi:response regulator transcription factor [Naumannella halotolerans]|uniref:DNA-binding response OmpR family regulator n=1 Tax=Naumannella halotolerans TaxID=993414 RepID=A0A4R7JCC9_9ACTN|nr:response regulator transcription factor [Naumannella halotolerans]TDT34357.1 DNA-binding response OmpR family regulator [Naumannella halotolerans]
MATILIAEDEQNISRFIDKGLRTAGYGTAVVTDGLSAVDHAGSGGYDLLVLDVGLPRMDGFTVLKALRNMGNPIPIIMCTARDSVDDTINGLDSGADDYLVKPFRFEELLARIRTRLRPPLSAGVQTPSTITHGLIELDPVNRSVRKAGREIELSAREFSMLREFLDHPNQVLTREQLLSRVWGFDFHSASNVVDVYVRYLRGKLGAEVIQTVRGVGYRLGSN